MIGLNNISCTETGCYNLSFMFRMQLLLLGFSHFQWKTWKFHIFDGWIQVLQAKRKNKVTIFMLCLNKAWFSRIRNWVVTAVLKMWSYWDMQLFVYKKCFAAIKRFISGYYKKLHHWWDNSRNYRGNISAETYKAKLQNFSKLF